MVSSGFVVLVEAGVFGAFPVFLLTWVSTDKCLLSYVLWAKVLVSLDLLLVDGCTSGGGLCAAS